MINIVVNMIHIIKNKIYLIFLFCFLFADPSNARIVDTIEALQPKSLGKEGAPVKMIEFASFTCGHCARFHNDVFPLIKKEYIDSGKIYFTYNDFPLDKFALKASVIARCSGKDKYFNFLKVLYKKQSDWTSSQDPFKSLLKIAKLGGLKNDEIKVCVGNQSIEDGILKKRLNSTKKFNITATPTIYLNGEKYDGDLTYEALKLKLDSLIN